MMPRVHFPPVDSLPSNVRGMIYEFDRNTPAAMDAAFSIAISKMSHAVQGLFDVSPRPGMVLPCSMIVLVIAESGTGKTLLENKTSVGFRQFDAQRQQIFEDELVAYRSLLDVHKSIRKGILKELKSAEADADDLQRQLIAHDKNAPRSPTAVKTNYSDATLSGLIDGMSQWPIGYYASDESAFLVDHRLDEEISFINSCYSGSGVSKRTGRGQISISDPRLTVLWQMQYSVFVRMCEKHGLRLESEGFYARSLICLCISKPLPFYAPSAPSWEKTDEFNDRCLALLKQSVGPDGRPVPKKVLKFDLVAQSVFDQEVFYTQSQKQMGGCLQFFPALAAKIPENLAKLAAIFHVFEGLEGDISVETVQRAVMAVRWFVEEQVRTFTYPPAPPQEAKDASKLMSWLANFVRTHDRLCLPKSELLRSGPRCTRSAPRLNAALLHLWRRGCLEEKALSEESKTIFVILKPEFFTQEYIYFWCGPNPGFPA